MDPIKNDKKNQVNNGAYVKKTHKASQHTPIIEAMAWSLLALALWLMWYGY